MTTLVSENGTGKGSYLLTEVGRRAIGKVDRLVRAGEILDCGGVDVDEKRQTEDRIQIRKKLLVDMTNDLRHYGWEVEGLRTGWFVIKRGRVEYAVRDVYCVAAFCTGLFYGLKGEGAKSPEER